MYNRTARDSLRGMLIGLLIALMVLAYGGSRCQQPVTSRPIWGDYTAQCVWDRGHVESLRVCDLQSDKEANLGWGSRIVVERMARRAITQELDRVRGAHTRAAIDIRVYGNIFPCCVAIRFTEFDNPSVPNLKQRFVTLRR